MYVKKISDEQFVLDCVNKELEIANSGLHFETFEDLRNWANGLEEKGIRWFDEYAFISEEQYQEWRKYFMEHFYDWQPKVIPKSKAQMEFGWFNLSWGLRCDFEIYKQK